MENGKVTGQGREARGTKVKKSLKGVDKAKHWKRRGDRIAR